MAREDLSPVVEHAVMGSLFGALPPESRELVLADALRLDVTAASFLH